MTNINETKTEPREQFWDIIEDARMVMLGSPDPSHHMQPMAPQVDDDQETIWFFTRKDSELVGAIGSQSHCIRMCFTQKNYQASVDGIIRQEMNPAALEEFWSPVVAAWYKDGKSDPMLTMLRFDPTDASVWASSGNPLRFVWEIAKANLTDKTADLGERTSIEFA